MLQDGMALLGCALRLDPPPWKWTEDCRHKFGYFASYDVLRCLSVTTRFQAKSLRGIGTGPDVDFLLSAKSLRERDGDLILRI